VLRILGGQCKTGTSNFKPEGEGVTALKMDFGPGYRIYFGQDGRELIVLLIGGDKSKQSEDIATAQEYWKEYNA
jgi:putative addiction module killer protein